MIEIREAQFFAAERLLEKHAFSRRLRSLDALQLAVALGLKDEGLAGHFVAADQALCDAAAEEGFLVVNPERP